MEQELKDRVFDLFEKSSALIRSLGHRKRQKIDEIEVVFVHNVNGRNKPARASSFQFVLEAIEDGGRPIGLILVEYLDAESMKMMLFPNPNPGDEELLATAFAESQDEQKEFNENEDDE